uniref:Macro domain-containing protein n=1 Tax=Myripristis murdjan TaxID=586833 RepID=A0A667WN24_9TELE
MLGKFLGVGSNVEIELRDTELLLFTLCSDKLDEIEKAVLDKFKEEKVDVPDCSAVPSELKEKLESKVLVCQGDITKEHADALVNAANEDLDHVGGVAAALSHAGGPQVQEESSALVKQVGKIPTGDAVVTTGGNLNCYKLLHAVGPVQGRAGGRERELLEKAVCSALNLAEMMEFQSIAIPCISSGTYGVPIRVCTEAIVAWSTIVQTVNVDIISVFIMNDKKQF